ncbi:MAG TPA: hypothetical protein VFM10_11320 [Terriglobales bacterium]|nr:hypothetical protein [Terriglobales bacterium]
MYQANPIKKAVRAAEWRAKRDGRVFDLTVDDLEVPELCPVFGTPMLRPSLDRINNNLGYTRKNTRVISWEANRLKHALTLEQARALVRYMEGG